MVNETKSAAMNSPNKKRRRWLKILLVAVAVILVLIGLTPTIISTDSVRRIAVGRINREIAGELSIDSWSIGWFSGVKLKGISLVDKDSEPVASIEAVSLDPSYLSLLGQGPVLGQISIDRPHLEIRFGSDGETNLEEIISGPKPQLPSREPSAKRPSFDLKIDNGTVIIHQPEAEPLSINNIKADVQMSAGDQPLSFEFSCDFTDSRGAGKISAQGSVPRKKDGQFESAQLQTELQAEVDQFHLGLLSPLFRRAGVDMKIAGRLDAKAEGHIKGLQNVQLWGQAACPDIHLSGPVLKTDNFHIRDFSGTIDIDHQDNKLNFRSLELSSDLGSVQAEGVASFTSEAERFELNSVELSGSLSGDLPKILNQLPATVHLRSGLKITGGDFRAKYAFNRSGNKDRLTGTAVLKNLQGTVEQRIVQLDEAVELGFNVERDGENLDIGQLSLNSGFGEVSLSGKASDLDFRSRFSLDKLNSEMAEFIDLGALSFAGEVLCNGSVRRDAEQAEFQLGITGKELLVRGLGREDLHEPQLQLSLTGSVSNYGDWPKSTVVVKQAKLDSQIARLDLSGQAVLEPLAVTAGLQLDSDVGRLWNLLSAFRTLPEGLELQGDLGSGLQISTSKPQTIACVGSTTLRNLQISRPDGTRLSEPEVLVKQRINYDLKSKTLASDLLELNLAGLNASVEKLEVAEQSDGNLDIEAQGDFQANLAQLEPWMVMFRKLGPNTRLAGQVFGKGSIRSKGQQSDFQVSITGKELMVSGLGKGDIHEPQLQLDLTGSVSNYGDWPKSTVIIKQAKLDSQIARLDLSGQAALEPLAVKAGLKLDSDLGQVWNLASIFRDLPKDVKLAGGLGSELQISTVSPEAVTCTGSTTVRGLEIIRKDKPTLTEPEMLIKHQLSYDVKSKTLGSDLLELSLAGLKALVERLEVAKQDDGNLDVKAQGKYQADIMKLRPWMLALGKLDAKTNLSGQSSGQVSYSRVGGKEHLELTSEIVNLQVQTADQKTFNEPRIKLALESDADRGKKVFEIRQLKVDSSFLQAIAEATSGLGQGGSPAKINLQGQCDLARLSQLVRPWKPDLPALQGTGRVDVNLTGPAPQAVGPEWVQALSGPGMIRFDQQLLKGLSVGPAEIKMQVDQGYLTINRTDMPANEGTMTILGRVGLAGKKPFLVVGESTQLLSNVQVNQQMSDEILKFVNPIFANNNQVSGMVNFRCDRLIIDDPATWKQNARMIGELSGKDLRIQSRGGLMHDLATILKLDLSAQMGQLKPVTIKLANGVISYEDMHIVFGSLVDLSFSGKVGPEDKLNMKLGVPVLPAMLGNRPELIKYIGDQRIYLPISGTVNNPRLDVAALPKALEPLISKALKILAAEQIGGFLEDILKPKQPTTPAPNP